MTAGRFPTDPAWLERLVEHRAGDALRLVAAGYGRSMTEVRNWLRETLPRLGLSSRPGGGPREPGESGQVLRFPDEDCLSAAGVGGMAGSTEPIQLARYRETTPDQKRGGGRNDLGASTGESGPGRVDAIDHLDEIRAAYWAGSALDDLADQWGVSPMTIAIWVYRPADQ